MNDLLRKSSKSCFDYPVLIFLEKCFLKDLIFILVDQPRENDSPVTLPIINISTRNLFIGIPTSGPCRAVFP